MYYRKSVAGSDKHQYYSNWRSLRLIWRKQVNAEAEDWHFDKTTMLQFRILNSGHVKKVA